MKLHVLLVGPIPQPIGGVSTHVLSLAEGLVAGGINCTIMDAYPECQKSVPTGVKYLLNVNHGHLPAILWLWRNLRKEPGVVVHLHFSRLVGRFALLALLLVRGHRKFILTLHHGDQEAVLNKAAWPMRIMSSLALRRMDLIVALSEKQRRFYQSLGLRQERIASWPLAITSSAVPDEKLLCARIKELKAIEQGGDESIMITSGYPHRSYNYELCIELLDLLSERFPCRLIVCLYGTSHDSQYEGDLRAKLTGHPKVILLGPMPAAEFLAVLAKASLYLRPSTVDSYGLAVTDALNVGTPCLASNICARDERCETYSADDKKAFIRQATALIERGRKLGKKPAILKADSCQTERILAFYHRLYRQ